MAITAGINLNDIKLAGGLNSYFELGAKEAEAAVATADAQLQIANRISTSMQESAMTIQQKQEAAKRRESYNEKLTQINSLDALIQKAANDTSYASQLVEDLKTKREELIRELFDIK